MADTKKHHFTVKSIVNGFLIIAAIVGIAYGFISWLDNRIDERLNDPSITSKIAKQIRPFAIFNGTGTILVDNGAIDYLAKELLIQHDENKRVPNKITIYPKQYMAHAPIITPMTQIGVIALPKRGKGISWEITLKASYIIEPEVGPDKKTSAEDDRYRLEIIK